MQSAALISGVLSLLLSAPTLAQSVTTRVSLDSAGLEVHGDSFGPAMSSDGRYQVFISAAADVVPGDTNALSDVFVRDRQTGQVERVDISTAGAQANDATLLPLDSISADGRRVVFLSDATNLIANDTNVERDAFVRDRQLGTTKRVSIGTGAIEGNGRTGIAAISADGRYVVFSSRSSNLVPLDTNFAYDIFVRDLQLGTTQRVSLDSNGVEGDADSASCVISGDGKFVAFSSGATNLVPSDTNGTYDVFVRDVLGGVTTRVSVDTSGIEGNDVSAVAALSGDGRIVAFTSWATNLVPGDTNLATDAFVHDRQTAITTRVSVSSSGGNSDGPSYAKQLSSDGRWLVFASSASNLVAGDSNVASDVFLHDRQNAFTVRISVGASGNEGDLDSGDGTISFDGTRVGFSSLATNFVPGDTNASWDAFVHDVASSCTAPQYCTSSTTSHGCVPSMAATGTASASATSGFTLTCDHLEGQRPGLVFYGTSGAQALPWSLGSTSFLCVKPPTQRTGVQSSGGTLGSCDGAIALDIAAFWNANPFALGQPIHAGQTLHAQTWFRDPPAPKTTNLSNGVQITLCP